jgi:hypothetical protein
MIKGGIKSQEKHHPLLYHDPDPILDKWWLGHVEYFVGKCQSGN